MKKNLALLLVLALVMSLTCGFARTPIASEDAEPAEQTDQEKADEVAALIDAIKKRQKELKEHYKDDQRMIRLLDDEQSQLQRINSWTRQYTATKDDYVPMDVTIHSGPDASWLELPIIK